jgi:Ca2+-binding RTX toxin-like protein
MGFDVSRPTCAAEPLEHRKLMAMVFATAPGVVHAWGTLNVPNTVTIALTPDGTGLVATVTAQTSAGPVVTTRTFPKNRVRVLDLRGGNLGDTITVDQTNGAIHSPARVTAFGGDNVVTTGDELDVIVTGNGNDSITSGDGGGVIMANAGNDTIFAGSGNDRINGGMGNDYINAGDGNNRVAGGQGYDTLIGGSGKDLLAGNAGLDSLDGGGGNDVLIDGRSKDTLIGGDGVDLFWTLNIKKANPVNDYTPGVDRVRIIRPTSSSGNSIFDDLLNNIFWPL